MGYNAGKYLRPEWAENLVMSKEASPNPLPSSAQLLSLIEVLTRQRDSSLVRLNVMKSLLTLMRPENIKLYDVVKQGDHYGVVLAVWNEGERLHFSEGVMSEDKVEPVIAGSLLEQSLGKDIAILCDAQNGEHECCIPVRMNDEPVSLFLMRGQAPFHAESLDIAMGMISVYRNYLALLQDSQHDSLTRLLNRKTFDAGFSLFLSSVSHCGESVHEGFEDRRSYMEGSHWLAVMDIDHFKRINDTFGHLYGDEVLILMAELMRRSFRQGDRLYRFGGEEFVVLLRDIDFDDAKRKLEAFRETVEKNIFPQVGQVTISIGFTSVNSTSMPTGVLGEADEALYYAKEHGRNMVCCYGELLEQKLVSKKTVHTEAEFF